MQEASLHMYEHSVSAYACSRQWDESLLDNLAGFCAANSITVKGMFVHHLPEPGVFDGSAQRSSASICIADYRMFVTSKYGCSAIHQYDAIAGPLEVSTEV
jgi:hypothetical protein